MMQCLPHLVHVSICQTVDIDLLTDPILMLRSRLQAEHNRTGFVTDCGIVVCYALVRFVDADPPPSKHTWMDLALLPRAMH